MNCMNKFIKTGKIKKELSNVYKINCHLQVDCNYSYVRQKGN